MTISKPSGRLVGIQTGRGIAALLVVLYHTGRGIALPQYVGAIPFGGLFNFGHAGVDFFFVLSGFVIHYVHHGDIRGLLKKRAVWDSQISRRVIQALDVDQAEPWPDGRDCQEDEALPLGPDGRGVDTDCAFDAGTEPPWPAAER